MRRSRRKAETFLLRALKLAPWALIGGAMVTPAHAASAIASDDLTLPILIGSIVLLVIGLVMKAMRGKSVQPPRSNGFSEGIGRYRLQLGRGDGD
jgi:hypothetical protein